MSLSDPVSPSGTVPVFPLPSVVFFPDTVLPLHVFEERYRALVRDAASGEGLIAISLLQPGWESDYEGNPSFHPVGTVGRIAELTQLPDGRFDLRLMGLTRARLGEVLRNSPYRQVRMTLLPEGRVEEHAPEIVAAKLDLLTSHGCVLRELAAQHGPVILDESVSFAAAVNAACAGLPIDADLRQRLLEQDDLMLRQRMAREVLDQLLARLLELKRERGDSGDN